MKEVIFINKKSLPIGVFDSGIGGLTVLEELMKKLPNEDFIYIADQGHCPYGNKTEKEIIDCVINVGKYLFKQNVKAIVIACNTASLFKAHLENITGIPIISVIEPTCQRTIAITKNKRVGVIGTETTIRKAQYQKMLEEMGIKVFAVPCQNFVDFVEHHDLNDPQGDDIVYEKLFPLKDKKIDTLIHGCTHFSIIEDKIRNVLGDINYVACGNPTSDELFDVLKENALLNDFKHNRYVKIFTTGNKDEALQNMKWFNIPHDKIEHLDL